LAEALTDFDSFFQKAFEVKEPFNYQRRLALDDPLYSLVSVPTGAGKTAAVLGAWLWRRLREDGSVGRRLIYCLPMRTLVEQTRDVACRAVERLGLTGRFPVYILMGGDVEDDWEHQPDRECILIGTQDMLLSRALNRGYAMSRFKWPLHYGLLNNDCLWVFDEIQLMGDGLATTTQLAAFRQQFKTFGATNSIWMSATLDIAWLRTVDFARHVGSLLALELDERDRATPALAGRLNAVKHLRRAPPDCRTPKGLAAFALKNHEPGSQTLIVVNRVARAREVLNALESHYSHELRITQRRSDKSGLTLSRPEIELVHSRFRPQERVRWKDVFKSAYGENGRIIVATQVVEAGVDISSRLLITDLAPYANLVQRFGRCNRRGESEEAFVYWVDVPLDERSEKLKSKEFLEEGDQRLAAIPYEWEALQTARTQLEELQSAAPADLEKIDHHDPFTPEHILRRRDLLDLFDTTTDLSGYDLDVSRFVRGADEKDVSVAWRDLGSEKPSARLPRLVRDELCSVPIGQVRTFLEGNGVDGKPRRAWRWDSLAGEWQTIRPEEIFPGATLLLDVTSGGYDVRLGWNPQAKPRIVPSAEPKAGVGPEEGQDDEPLSFHWRKYLQTLSAHSREAKGQAEQIVRALGGLGLDEYRKDLVTATQHHDWGKCHAVFQETLHKGVSVDQSVLLAKSIGKNRHSRPRFRHELASALALLQTGENNLVCYLAACHHGKVRLSIRALPDEKKPEDQGLKFARGVWDCDLLPVADLGDGVAKTGVKLDLEPMLLGASADGDPSWLARMIEVRDQLGVFRLAFLECLIRAADVRASENPQDFWTH
jgi:CRISPR-associated endonuclease/helicase Cas3